MLESLSGVEFFFFMRELTLEEFLESHIKRGSRIFTLVASSSLLADKRPRFFIYSNFERNSPIDFIVKGNALECIPTNENHLTPKTSKKKSSGDESSTDIPGCGS